MTVLYFCRRISIFFHDKNYRYKFILLEFCSDDNIQYTDKSEFFIRQFLMKNQPKHLDESFEHVCRELLEMFIKKHRDYGKGNILDTGEMGILFRISDKINRLKNLLGNHKKPGNETMEDNWLDIAVYAIIALQLRRGWFKKLKLSAKAGRAE